MGSIRTVACCRSGPISCSWLATRMALACRAGATRCACRLAARALCGRPLRIVGTGATPSHSGPLSRATTRCLLRSTLSRWPGRRSGSTCLPRRYSRRPDARSLGRGCAAAWRASRPPSSLSCATRPGTGAAAPSTPPSKLLSRRRCQRHVRYNRPLPPPQSPVPSPSPGHLMPPAQLRLRSPPPPPSAPPSIPRATPPRLGALWR